MADLTDHEGRDPAARLARELLGRVTAPSGVLAVVDAGLLHLWCHDEPPAMPEGVLSDETTRAVNAGTDYVIEGPDAERAGRAFDRQWHPRHLYDLHAGDGERFGRTFNECVRRHDLIARLVPLPQRIPHRRRIDLALEHGRGAGEFQFFGVMASAVGGVPPGASLDVYGERMPEGSPDAGRWRRVYVECLPGAPAARTEEVGKVGVDEARLMFADADALGHWRHDEPLDGKADYVFWGRDAEHAAREAGAPRLGEDLWGWTDLPEEEAVKRGMAFQRQRDERGWTLAVDYRPHSHHYLLMRQVLRSATESGTASVGGADVCLFMTSWGDGVFTVYRELDADGRLVRVGVDVGSDEIVQRQRRFEEWWFGAFAESAVVSRRVLDDGAPVGYLQRNEPRGSDDSGWDVYAGDEDDEYCADAGNFAAAPLRELIQRDRALEDLFRAPPGSAFDRPVPGGEFVAVGEEE